jgi:arginine repressor
MKTKAQAKISKVMKEFGAGKLHSGSKKGPEVTSRKQAVAIALSEANKTKKPKK